MSAPGGVSCLSTTPVPEPRPSVGAFRLWRRACHRRGLDAEDDDYKLLERGSFVYDALYAWCARDVTKT